MFFSGCNWTTYCAAPTLRFMHVCSLVLHMACTASSNGSVARSSLTPPKPSFWSAGQLQAALVSKLVQVGGQSRAYFIAVARAMGFAIAITEGWKEVDTVISPVNNPLANSGWIYVWTITTPVGDTKTTLTVNGRVSDPLAAWGNTLLECVMRRIKPAHTTLLFSYT